MAVVRLAQVCLDGALAYIDLDYTPPAGQDDPEAANTLTVYNSVTAVNGLPVPVTAWAQKNAVRRERRVAPGETFTIDLSSLSAVTRRNMTCGLVT